MSRREEILAKSASDRYLPPSRLELLRILQDPDASAATLTRAIECDPTLTANVLRLANSAYFGFPRSVASVADAVWRLGTRNLRQLVLATTFSPMQKQAVKGYDLPAGDLLRHSVAVAVGAETLSRLLDVPACDHLFTAGILHDIGKIALGTFVELDAAPILELATREGLPFVEAEQRILGIDHAELGAFLADRWNLPDEVVEIVRWHHEPEKFSGRNPAGDLVHVADALCILGGIGIGTDGLRYRPSEEVCDRLGLTETATEQALSMILLGLEDLEGAFS
jgi:putative nucleotidyltransferase with HDIG domain